MNIKKYAFSLSEVLITLAIIGVIAILVVPKITTGVQSKTNAAALKNSVATIEQLATDQLLVHRTRDLTLTDFGSSSTLLTPANFEIAKTYTSTDNPWNNGYKSINGTSIALSNAGRTIKLKNGVLVRYNYMANNPDVADTYKISGDDNDYAIGEIIVDINASEKPNVIGRDVFSFYVTKKGRVATLLDFPEIGIQKTDCTNEGQSDVCASLVIENNWKIEY